MPTECQVASSSAWKKPIRRNGGVGWMKTSANLLANLLASSSLPHQEEHHTYLRNDQHPCPLPCGGGCVWPPATAIHQRICWCDGVGKGAVFSMKHSRSLSAQWACARLKGASRRKNACLLCPVTIIVFQHGPTSGRCALDNVKLTRPRYISGQCSSHMQTNRPRMKRRILMYVSCLGQ